MQSLKEAIQQMLEQRAAQEPQFALKLKNPNKNIDDCVKFVFGEVFHKYVTKQTGVQVAAPSREEVFGIAVHYYDEDSVKIRPMSGVLRAAASGSAGTASKSRAKKADKESVKSGAKVAQKQNKREKKADAKKADKPAARKSKKPAVEDVFFGSLFDASMFE